MSSKDKAMASRRTLLAAVAVIVILFVVLYAKIARMESTEHEMRLQIESLLGQQSQRSSPESTFVEPRSVVAAPYDTPSPPNQPSVLVATEERPYDQKNLAANIYGGAGAGDKAHLGGFTQLDTFGMSPAVWQYLMRDMTVKSMVDLGCGKGVSTSWFMDHGADVLCVEGSHDGVLQSLLPQDKVVEHDFTRGPWWPKDTYDLAWSVEFLEHVQRPYFRNYLPILHRAALLVVTHSIWGGHHHVEVHEQEWWQRRLEMEGFVFSPSMTQKIKSVAQDASNDLTPVGKLSEAERGFSCGTPKGSQSCFYKAQHLWTHLLVFINPAVAQLPKHDHLFHEIGCYNDQGKTDCEGDDKLPDKYLPIAKAAENNDAWEKRVFVDSGMIADVKAGKF